MKRLLTMAMLLLAACSSTASQCKPGENGCPCVAQGCNAGLICAQNVCVTESHAGLSMDSAARGCEVLLSDGSGKVDGVDFGDQVTGRWLRQGDKVAAAFAANRDSPMGGVQVSFTGGFTVLNSHCYGARGEELPGAAVHQ